MAERDWHIHMARVYIAQARHARLRGHATFHATLLKWAARRRIAAQAPTMFDGQRGQGNLF